jgi:hypothetical protein
LFKPIRTKLFYFKSFSKFWSNFSRIYRWPGVWIWDQIFKNFFGSIFLYKGSLFLQKNVFFIRVHRRVIGVEELESAVSFVKLFSDRFFTQRLTFFANKIFFPFAKRKSYIVENIPAKYSKWFVCLSQSKTSSSILSLSVLIELC